MWEIFTSVANRLKQILLILIPAEDVTIERILKCERVMAYYRKALLSAPIETNRRVTFSQSL